MGTIIKFPTPTCQDVDINYDGLELFVASCCKLLDTLPVEARCPAKQEFNRLVEGLLQFLDECEEVRSSE
jgi:hypothetical protein